MILMRETTPTAILRLTVAAGASTPSTRNSTRVSPSSGLTWMSEAPCWIACATIECTSLMIGASLSASSTSRLPASSPVLGLLVDDVFDRVVHARRGARAAG